MFSKKRYYIVNYTIIDGEHEYVDNVLIKTKAEMLILDCENYFKTFFGEGTKREDGAYTDGERALKVGRCQELTKEEYGILIKYISGIIQ